MNGNYMELIREELVGLYGEEVIRDQSRIITLYNYYDGIGQDWQLPSGMDFTPTKKKTNYIKKLIKEEARFLFGKPPEVIIRAKNQEIMENLQAYINKTLKENLFSDKIIKAARDCFIGKRVAIKLSFSKETGIKFFFKNSLEFVYETMDDDVDNLNKIIFFYGLNDKEQKIEQRIWKQKYHISQEDGSCILNEGIYDGYGRPIEKKYTDYNTGLDFIPAKVIINDGLSGDLNGESDVEELMELQNIYNRLTSDDIDALKFNMFPQTVAVNASESSLESLSIAPNALIDLQTEIGAEDSGRANLYKLETSFNYGDKYENTVSRLKEEMFEILSVPNISLEQLTGVMASGKSMKALYWPLITRCEEKYTAWRPALEWLVNGILAMSKFYNVLDYELPEDLFVSVENIYPLMEEELEEKTSDLLAVSNKVMSRKAYIKKWNAEMSTLDIEEEIRQIRQEKI